MSGRISLLKSIKTRSNWVFYGFFRLYLNSDHPSIIYDLLSSTGRSLQQKVRFERMQTMLQGESEGDRIREGELVVFKRMRERIFRK